MTAGALKEYIGNIYHLEVSLYNQQSLFKSILDETNRIAKFKGQELNTVWSTKFDFNIKDIMSFVILGACFGTLVGAFSSVPFFAGTAGGIVIALIIFAISEYSSIIKANRDNKKINAANQEIIRNNQVRQDAIRRKRDVLNQELEVIKVSHAKTKSILERYYNKDIVFPKYRNLLAISSIYEYLSSGRCYTLEGHEGAYNIFENEVRQNIIISKLDDVIRHLEKIESNQYMLYSAIQESNANTQRLTQELYKVADNLQRIETNTEITAYNSRITAQNTEFLKWFEIFRE